MENKHKWTVQKCPCTDPDCNRYTVESNFMSKNDAELIAASAPSLQSEIDRLKEEKKELIEAIVDVIKLTDWVYDPSGGADVLKIHQWNLNTSKLISRIKQTS